MTTRSDVLILTLITGLTIAGCGHAELSRTELPTRT
jgi:hypothetical protein